MALSPKRKGRLTASNFAAAIGLNPYMSRQKLFRQLEGIDPPFEGNEMTEYGNEHEQDAVDAYEAVTGVILDKTGDDQEFIIHKEYDWLGCTPDGVINNSHITEFKCPYRQELYKNIPTYYIPQIQGQMEITSSELCDFMCWTPNEIAVWRVKYSKEYWDKMFKLLERFYTDWKSGKEPAKMRKPSMPEINVERIL